MNDEEHDAFIHMDDTMEFIGKLIGWVLGFMVFCFILGFIYGRWVA